MAVTPKTDGRKRAMTRERALAMVARRKELGIKSGRPKGVLNKATILKIQSRDSFVTEGLKHVGKVQDDLLRNSSAGDTRASLGFLDRVGIAPVQKVEGEIKFSLAELGKSREMIDGNADVISVDAPKEDVEVPSQVE